MSVTINLKVFLEDIFIALSSNNEEDIKELDEKFKHFYNNQKSETIGKVFDFLKKQKLYIENDFIIDYFQKFPMSK